MRTYECPNCGDDIEVRDKERLAESVSCSSCKTFFGVDTDAEFLDGMWRDRTKLYEINETKEPRQSN